MYKSLDNLEPSSLIEEVGEVENDGATQDKHEEIRWNLKGRGHDH